MNSILKNLLKRIIVAVLLLIVKKYIDLDLINDSVDNLIIAISALLWDFNPFTSEITKVFFNGNSSEEAEGSNRQNNNDNNNNTPNQDSSVSPSSNIEASEVTSGGMLEELIEDEEERRLEEERTLINAQLQARKDTRFIDQLTLDQRAAELDKRMRDFEDLKNQSESDESMIPILDDIKRKIIEDIEALNENTKRISDEIHAYNEEINKFYLDSAKLAGRKLEKSINKRNSE